MKLGPTEIKHFQVLVEELLFRLAEDGGLVIEDLEDEIKICAEILGIDPNLARDADDCRGY